MSLCCLHGGKEKNGYDGSRARPPSTSGDVRLAPLAPLVGIEATARVASGCRRVMVIDHKPLGTRVAGGPLCEGIMQFDKRGNWVVKTSRTQVRPPPSPAHWLVRSSCPHRDIPRGRLLRLHRGLAVSACGFCDKGGSPVSSEVFCTAMRWCDVSMVELRWRSGGLGTLNTRGHTVQDRDGGQVGIPVASGPANHLPPNRKLPTYRGRTVAA